MIFKAFGFSSLEQNRPAETQKLMHCLKQEGRLSSQWHIRCAQTLLNPLLPRDSELGKLILSNVSRMSPYVLVMTGIRYAAEKNNRKALEVFTLALSKMKQEDNLLRSFLLFQTEKTQGDLGQHEQTLDFLKRAAPGIRKHCGQNHPFTLGLYKFIGTTYEILQDYGKALSWVEKSYQGFNASFGEEHIGTLETMYWLGSIKYRTPEYTTAKFWIERTR